MFNTIHNKVRRFLVASAIGGPVLFAMAMGGCDATGLGQLVPGLSGSWSVGGYSGASLYDASGIIQSAYNDRQAAMGRAATAWDQYITGDYYGGDNDDPSTPTAWASGYTWP
jgi:hypothetical protein